MKEYIKGECAVIKVAEAFQLITAYYLHINKLKYIVQLYNIKIKFKLILLT